MSDLENPHYHRKVGYSMILVAASLAAIGVLYMMIGENVLFADEIQRENTRHFEECKENKFYQDIRTTIIGEEKMKYLASVEQITGLFLVDVMPEDAAKQIRDFHQKNGISSNEHLNHFSVTHIECSK